RSTRTKAGFKGICVEKGLQSPHNLRRDVKTRWNGTAQLLQDGERLYPAIVAYQNAHNYPRRCKLTKDELKGIRILLSLLKPLESMTLSLSRASVPMLGNVIVLYDSLNHDYSQMCRNINLPVWACDGANCARLKFTKYYQKSDESVLYRLAILLNPSFRVHYLTRAEWPEDWIDTAVDLLEEYWEKHYKRIQAPADEPDATSEYSHSSYMDQVCAQLDGISGYKESSPVTCFIKARSLSDPKAGEPSQSTRSLGEHDGLTQMAIDVLSTPATSVDVERMFSFVSAMVSKRRHKLGALTIQASASLGAYLRANLVQLGCLKRAYKQKAEQKKKEAQRRAVIEAETVVVDDGEDEDDDEDDEGEVEPLPQKT
ncbi:hypothetical protein FRC11_003774, partial [Ceratobasidium sp. 423]